MLTTQIKQADNWAMIDHLLDVYDPQALNPIHVAAAFRQLLQLKRSHSRHQSATDADDLHATAAPLPHRGSSQSSRQPLRSGLQQQGAQGLMLRLCNVVLEHQGRLRPREAAGILWGASGLGFSLPPEVLDVIMQVRASLQSLSTVWPMFTQSDATINSHCDTHNEAAACLCCTHAGCDQPVRAV
jgi:hypothetical protein